MNISFEAFEQAIIEFTHFKTRDSDALLFPSSGTITTPSVTKVSLPNKNITSNYYDNSHDIYPNINNAEMNVIQYYFFRRYLINQTQEAIAAALEDIVQYKLITAPASRLKWARAIIASIESESTCSPILMSLTQPPGTSTTTSHHSKDTTLNITLEWNLIKERVTTATTLSTYALSITNSSNNISSLPSIPNFELSTMTIDQIHSCILLPDNLFTIIFHYFLEQLHSVTIPLFNQSSEYAAYLHMSCCIIEQYYKAINNHQQVISSLPSPTLSALTRLGISMDIHPSISNQSTTTYNSLTTSNSSSNSSQINTYTEVNTGPLSSSSSLSTSSTTNNTISNILDSLSRLELSMNDFERLGVIGSGSYGSVYVWRLQTTGILYAVKEMDKKILKSKSSVHTVIRELACSLAADTPFICGFDFAFTTSTSIYMGMQFAPHGDLERWLLAQNTKRFDEITARFYIAQIIISLKHLHQAGVIHRDLKASNVLIDGAGNVILTDHGLSVYAHRCSTTAPDYARVCWGEKPDSTDICCLGCLQVSKLKEMQKIAERCEQDGLSIAASGYVAAEVLRYRFTKDIQLDTIRNTRYTKPLSNPNNYTENTSTMLSAASYSSSTVNNNSTVTTSDKNGAAAMPGNNVSIANSSASTVTNTNIVPAPPATKSSSSGFAFTFRNFISGASRSTSTNKVAPAPNAVPKDSTNMDIDTSIPNPNYFKPSAHNLNHGSSNNYPSDGLSRVTQMNPSEYEQYMTENGFINCGVSCISGASGMSRLSRANSRTDNHINNNHIVARPTNSNLPNLSSSVLNAISTLADDTIGASLPVQQATIHHYLQTCFVNPVVLVASDCHCPKKQDGGSWYRGRAGTSAYWCPEMIKRDTSGDRISYGMEADFWSLGCLTYALMTGRSPFATGLGTSYDNAQTLEGASKIHWPKGIFSRDAKDFIARLCTVDPQRRLGAGVEGWRSVMMHPWFKGMDFALLEARVLPPPCIPTYKISTDWKTIPDKIENQHKGTAAEEAAAAEAQARAAAATAVLSSEDEAIFRACTYTSPDLFTRAWLRFASMHTIDNILALPLEHIDTSTLSIQAINSRATRLHSCRSKYSSDDMEVENNIPVRRRSQSESNIIGQPSTINNTSSTNIQGSSNSSRPINHHHTKSPLNVFTRSQSMNYGNESNINMDTTETGPEVRTNGRAAMLPVVRSTNTDSSSSSTVTNLPRRNPLPLYQINNTITSRANTTTTNSTNNNGIMSPPTGLGVAIRNNQHVNNNNPKSNTNNHKDSELSNHSGKSNRIISRLTH